MKKRISVTIFIHGTLPPAPVLKVPLVKRFFHCPQGLTLLSELSPCHTKEILTTLCASDPETYDAEHCYTYGWSGLFSHSAREEAARQLFTHVDELKKKYQSQQQEPHFTILTHSHGGNVALCLSRVAQEKNYTELVIEKLILLACPVQIKTASYSTAPLFRKVYSIHSHHDLLQVIDPQGIHTFLEHLKNFGLEFTLANLKELGPLFSERHFPKNSSAHQLNVKYQHRELLHIEFLLPPFMSALPALVKSMDEKNSPDELVHVFT